MIARVYYKTFGHSPNFSSVIHDGHRARLLKNCSLLNQTPSFNACILSTKKPQTSEEMNMNKGLSRTIGFNLHLHSFFIIANLPSLQHDTPVKLILSQLLLMLPNWYLGMQISEFSRPNFEFGLSEILGEVYTQHEEKSYLFLIRAI